MLPRILSALQQFSRQAWSWWRGLSRLRRIVLATIAITAFAGITIFRSRMADEAYRPLYTDLTDKEAGAAVSRLKELQVPYKLAANGSSILVPKERVPELRLQLASDGLPQMGRLGFEIFDETDFGATDFSEQVNFRRALEGELERSIQSLEEVDRSRVHISLPRRSVFLANEEPAKASVVVQLKWKAELDRRQVEAIAFLVASAVEGLKPGEVVVLDTAGSLLARPAGDEEKLSGAQLDYQRKVEAAITQKIHETVEPLVGFDKLRTSVVAECDWSEGEQTEEILDPNTVVLTTQKSEESTQPITQSGVPGTPSNLPRQPATAQATGRASSRSTETTNYQTSRTVTRMTLERGEVRRLSVAVLVDHKTVYEPTTAEPSRIPREPEELEAIREIIAASAGILPERGDVLTVQSLPFTIFEIPPEPPPPPAAPPEPTQLEIYYEKVKQYRYFILAGLAVFALIVVALRWWLKRRSMRARLRAEREALLAEEEARKELEAAQEEARRKEAEEAMLLRGLEVAQLQTSKGQIMKKHIEDTAKKDPGAFVDLLRSWLHEDDQ